MRQSVSGREDSLLVRLVIADDGQHTCAEPSVSIECPRRSRCDYVLQDAAVL